MKGTKDIMMNIEAQGRTKTWVMSYLGISRRTFYKRVEHNDWKDSELSKLKAIGLL